MGNISSISEAAYCKDILNKNFETHARKESTVFVTLVSVIILSSLQRCIIIPCVTCCDVLLKNAYNKVGLGGKALCTDA